MSTFMRKAAVLSNGSLAVGINELGLVSDFYYPYVGQQNLTNSRRRPHYIGIWVDGVFSWLHEHNDWDIRVDTSSKKLESQCLFESKSLEIRITTIDFVDYKYNILRRELTVENLSERERDIRVFFYQTFKLSQDGRTDTALYVPDDHYIYDYKGRVCLLVSAEVADEKPFDQWAIGNTDIEGKEGTFRDAEDGELSGALVEHSSVDSTLRCSFSLSAKKQKAVRYWVCVSDSQYEVERLHAICRTAWNSRSEANDQHWQMWMQKSEDKLVDLDDEKRGLVQCSLLTIKAHSDVHGGVVASLDSSIFNYGRDYYSYVWPRDGVYVMRPLLYLGHHKEVLQFLEFCARTMKPGGYMQHKYQPDGSVGSTWHPLDHHGGKRLAIQEDETASVLQLAVEYYNETQKEEFLNRHFESMMTRMASFLVTYRHPVTKLPYPSYDLWEEKLEVTTYTTAMVIKALRSYLELARKFAGNTDDAFLSEVSTAIEELTLAMSKLVTQDGYFAKGIKVNGELDTTVDASTLYGVISANLPYLSQIKKTYEAVEQRLVAENGGIIRYEHDNYFTKNGAPNPWFVTTLWLAQSSATVSLNNIERSHELLSYCVDYISSHSSKMLPEQVTPDESMQKIGVTPLIWSHAELIQTIMQLR